MLAARSVVRALLLGQRCGGAGVQVKPLLAFARVSAPRRAATSGGASKPAPAGTGQPAPGATPVSPNAGAGTGSGASGGAAKPRAMSDIHRVKRSRPFLTAALLGGPLAFIGIVGYRE
jgi:hypothetical protein